MIRAEFEAAAAEIAEVTAGEWRAVPLTVVAGKVAVIGLYFKGQEIIQAASLGKSREWMMQVATTIYKACLSYEIAQMVAA